MKQRQAPRYFNTSTNTSIHPCNQTDAYLFNGRWTEALIIRLHATTKLTYIPICTYTYAHTHTHISIYLVDGVNPTGSNNFYHFLVPFILCRPVSIHFCMSPSLPHTARNRRFSKASHCMLTNPGESRSSFVSFVIALPA